MRTLSVLIIFTVLSLKTLCCQSRCDTLRDGVYVVSEFPPKPNIAYNQLENILNSSINLNDYELPENNMIYVNFIINCKGEDFDFTVLKNIDKKLQDILIQTIHSNVKWTAGKQNGKNIDFSQTIVLKIKKNRFKILN